MPTELGHRFLTSWRGHPPHMLEPDIPVWFRFLDKYGDLFSALYYDCLLGGPWLTPEQKLDPMQVMWRHNTSKRADAIAELISEVWIIEVSAYPGLRAMGQLQTYQFLWNEDPQIDKTPRMLMVAERIDTDLAATMGKFNVHVYIV